MDRQKKYITKSFQETQKLGKNFALQILSGRAREIFAVKPQKTAVVLALQGDLGAGKTTFLQGFAKGLGIKETVNSPTFVIMKKFEIPAAGAAAPAATHPSLRGAQRRGNPAFKFFYHFDCYRTESPEEILGLGFREIISDPKNIVAIEWPEKIKNILPKNKISIAFNHLEENKREIMIDKP